MRKKYMEFRNKIIFILSIMLIAVCWGCQETPDEQIVVNKGNGELENIIASPAVSSQL
jgi:hypothetical protein